MGFAGRGWEDVCRADGGQQHKDVQFLAGDHQLSRGQLGGVFGCFSQTAEFPSDQQEENEEWQSASPIQAKSYWGRMSHKKFLKTTPKQ